MTMHYMIKMVITSFCLSLLVVDIVIKNDRLNNKMKQEYNVSIINNNMLIDVETLITNLNVIEFGLNDEFYISDLESIFYFLSRDKKNESMITLGVSRKGIITQVYPMNIQNERILGHDLNKDPKRIDGHKISEVHGNITIIGPVILKQNNKKGYIARKSIFNNGEYLGFVFVVVDEAYFFENLNKIKDFKFQIFGFNPDSTFQKDNLIISKCSCKVKPYNKYEFNIHESEFSIYIEDELDMYKYIIIFITLLIFFNISFYLLFVLYQKNVEFKKLSEIDILTGLYNRNVLNTFQVNHIKSLAIIDIDYFKQINDKYGHVVGDVVLKEFSCFLKKIFSEDDVIIRYGGEEFVVLIKNGSLKSSYLVCEHFRSGVEKEIIYIDSHEIKITCSIGLCTSNNISSVEDKIKSADIALYKAKESGRNKIIKTSL